MAIKRLEKFLGHPRKEATPNSVDWRRELSKNKLTREEFCNLCAEVARELFPEALVEHAPSGDELRITPKNGKLYTAFLENIWRSSKQDASSRVSQVERFFRIIGSSQNGSDDLPQLASIVPVIKDEEYLNNARKNGNEKVSLVHEHLVADLWIVYCIDKPETITTLKIEILSQLQLGQQPLRAIAIENLKRILPPVERHGDGPVYMLTAGSDYVASLLLFDDLWEEVGSSINGDIIAAVPSRDVILFTSSSSSEGILNMRQSVTRISETGGYLVSTTMLRRHDGGWTGFS